MYGNNSLEHDFGPQVGTMKTHQYQEGWILILQASRSFLCPLGLWAAAKYDPGPLQGYIRAVNEKVPPLIGPQKRIEKEIKLLFLFIAGTNRVQKLKF